MIIEEQVLFDLQMVRENKLKLQKQNLIQQKSDEIKVLMESYLAKLELCIDDETLINDAIAIREQVAVKQQELQALQNESEISNV